MIETRTYHGIALDIARAESERVCYILLPEGLKDDGMSWMEDAAGRFSVNIVVMYGMDWNDALTPWSADGVFRKSKPFGGRAELFLKDLKEDFFPSIETFLKLRKPERFLVGISLSGLFAVWSVFTSDLLKGIASISGSLWFDRFTSWCTSQTLSPSVRKIYLSLGDREKKSRDPRMATVEDATRQTADILRGKGADVEFVIEENTTHFSPAVPRLEKAFKALFPEETLIEK